MKNKLLLAFLAGALTFWAYNKYVYKERIEPQLKTSKSIGVIGAMQEEVDLLIKEMKSDSIVEYAGFIFHFGKISSKKTVVVKSGIGKTNSAIATQLLIDKFNSKTIINTGVAGSLDPELKTGEIVIGTTFKYHDVDVSDFGFARGVIPRMDTSVFYSNILLSSQILDICQKLNYQSKKGEILSGDLFVSDQAYKTGMMNDFPLALAVDMESTSIAQVCHLNNIPFAVIRVISDSADDGAMGDYKAFEKESAVKSAGIVKELILNSEF